MRSLPRILLNAATAVSLALCGAVCVLGARSIYRFDMACGNVGAAWVHVGSVRGQLELTVSNPSPYPGDKWMMLSSNDVALPTESYVWQFGGFGFANVGTIIRSPFWRVAMPHWFALVLLGIAPALFAGWAVGHKRSKKAGLCPACGYDLRATPGRCPEYGTIPGR